MDDVSLLYRLSTLFPSPNSTLHISTKRLGEHISLSQQSASRLLTRLSSDGLIEKTVSGRGHEIRLTDKGVALLEDMRRSLDEFLNEQDSVSFTGVVSTGLGEGAYYVHEYESRIKKKLGFTAYPGTLNVNLGRNPQELLRYTSIEVQGFNRDRRSYGVIRLAPVRLFHKKKSTDCFFILPERTHHRKEAEFISDVNLREKLGLSDGSRVKAVFKPA